MAMTRKNYEAVAAVLRDERENWDETPQVLTALDYVASRLAGVFAADNQAFDRGRFLAATGAAVNPDGSLQ